MTDPDIDADQAVFERVNERVSNGVPREMEMSSGETLPYIRAARRWHHAALNLWDEKLREGEDATLPSISCESVLSAVSVCPEPASFTPRTRFIHLPSPC